MRPRMVCILIPDPLDRAGNRRWSVVIVQGARESAQKAFDAHTSPIAPGKRIDEAPSPDRHADPQPPPE